MYFSKSKQIQYFPKLTKNVKLISINDDYFNDILKQQKIFTSRHVASEYFTNLKDTIFFSCHSLSTKYDGSEGGALFCSGVILSLTNCIFVNNSIIHNAGALKICSSTKTDIINSLFSENKADSFAGAIFCYLIYDISFQNTNFSYNSCKKEVGALALSLCDISSLSYCSFTCNNCSSKAALYTEVSEVIMKYCSFWFNDIYHFNNDNNSISLFCGEFSSVKISNTFFMSNVFHSCFIGTNASAIFENTVFSGSSDEEIINTTNNVYLNSCEFHTDSDYSTPFHVNTELIRKQLHQKNENGKEQRNKNKIKRNDQQITIPQELLKEIEMKESNIHKANIKAAISGTQFIIIFFVIYFCFLVLIYFVVKYLVTLNAKREQEKKDEEERQKLKELHDLEKRQNATNKKHKRKIVT